MQNTNSTVNSHYSNNTNQKGSDYRQTFPESPPSVPVIAVLNIQPETNFSQRFWNNIHAGADTAIQNLVSGILIGLGQVLIQSLAEMFQSDKNRLNTEDQTIKIALISGECDKIVDSSAKFYKNVIEMLARSEHHDASNYSKYLHIAAKCQIEKKKQSGTSS